MEREGQTSRSLSQELIMVRFGVRLYSTSKDGIQEVLVNMGEEP